MKQYKVVLEFSAEDDHAATAAYCDVAEAIPDENARGMLINETDNALVQGEVFLVHVPRNMKLG